MNQFRILVQPRRAPSIQLPSHRDYQRDIETGRSNISCNDLIEANRIEASRSWSKSPRGRVEESKFLANLIPTLNYRSRRIPWAALTFNPLVCFTGSEGGRVERWLDGARNTTARSLHPVFRHFILGLTFHPGESTDREPTGLLCDRVAHVGE